MINRICLCRFLFVASLMANSLLYACPIGWYDKMTGGQCINVNGYNMYIHSMGKKTPTVIFESGLGWDSPTWNQVAPQVARFAHVITYDRVGLGKSQVLVSKEPRTAQQIVDSLVVLLKKANFSPPYILVGHSIGGLYMQLFAREHPQDVKGVVLVDSVSVDDPMQDPLPDPSAPYYAEALGVTKSKLEVKKAALFPRVPLIVLSASHHKNVTPLDEKHLMLAQNGLAKMSIKSKHIIAESSGHYIQNDQPELVINAILQIINW